MTDERDADVRRRMASHELYTDAGDGLETLARQRQRGKELAFEFNATHPSQEADRERLLGEIFARVGERVWVEPPLQVSYGCHTHLGESVYVNFNLTVVDDGEVFIGNRVMIAPNVTITSTGHPVHPVLRTDGSQFSAPVRIEDDVWIGAGATILPGVVIGAGSVVAAGAVVAQNVPPMTVVGGVPARVIREITEADLEFRYRPPRDLPVPPQHWAAAAPA